jgi:dTDP-4-amino-4,6-dideoxy-D-galactose acyltransferase
MIYKVEWDTDFFGYPVGRYDFNSKKDIFVDEEFITDSSPFSLIYIFSNTQINSNLITLVDQKLTFKKKVDLSKKIVSNPVFFNPTIHSKLDLLNLVYLSGNHSRFKTDVNFKNAEFQKLYELWINKSLQNDTYSQIIVKFINGKLAGFVSFSFKDFDAKIELIAVDECFQGKGIGAELLSQVEEIARDKMCENLFVETQGLNLLAIRLYEKYNFTCINKTYIYHFWKQ